MISASFGITKFQLSGPLSTLPKNSALSGIASIPFLVTFLLNTMFVVRVFILEAAFFSTYRIKKPPADYNNTLFDNRLAFVNGSYNTVIDPVISPEHRLTVFFLPCLISISINLVHLLRTLKRNKKILIHYPQFIFTPAYSPFMYEGVRTDDDSNNYIIRVWKTGSILNAMFIGMLPSVSLMIIDCMRGVTNWDFLKTNVSDSTYVFNDAILKVNGGYMAFSIFTLLTFSAIIFLFFFNDKLFSKNGVYCKVCNIICCPCPKPCLTYNPEFISTDEPNLSPLSLKKPELEEGGEEKRRISFACDDNKTRTLIFSYRNRGMDRNWIAGKPDKQVKNLSEKVC